MSNRLTTIIQSLDREAEHKRRCERVLRSQAMYNAALIEANENDIVLTESQGVYRMADNRHNVAFYPITQVVMRTIIGKQRLDWIDLTAECDVLDIVLLFLAGEFLK